jgi:hypothetical protein
MQKIFFIISLLVLFTAPVLCAAENKNQAEARRLIDALGCKGCHKLQGDGSTLAPALDHIGSRLTRKQISDHLAAHAKTRKTGFMPSYNTTPKAELKIISEFLYNLQ